MLLLISLCLAQLRRRLMKENEKSFLLLFFNSQEGHFQISKNDPPPLPSLLSPQATPIFLSLPSFSPHLRKGRRRRVPFSFLLSWGSECGETLNFLGGEKGFCRIWMDHCYTTTSFYGHLLTRGDSRVVPPFSG